jgi:hypothetical protein
MDWALEENSWLGPSAILSADGIIEVVDKRSILFFDLVLYTN